jgi:PAS domain S-box-containing protein
MIILILLLAVPSILFVIHSGIEERGEAIQDARRECLTFVNSIAREQQSVVAGAQQLVAALARIPDVQTGNFPALNAILKNLRNDNPQYANIAITDKSGVVRASAIPLAERISVADRKYFQDAVRTGKYSSGEYVVGRIISKATINFGYPVKNASRDLIAVIFVSLDLDFSKRVFQSLDLPRGASFSLLDHRGIILQRSLTDELSEKLAGKRDIQDEIFTRMKEGPEEGTYDWEGNDGNFCLFAYRSIKLPHETDPYLYIRASVPEASAISVANALMFQRLSMLLSIFAFGMFLALFIGKRAIVNPIEVLKRASQQLAAGAGVVNVSSVVRGGELGELARSFDDMAEALVQSQRRLSDIIEFLPDATLVIDEDGKVIAWNRAIEAMTGIKAEAMLGRGDYEYAIPFYGERRPILIDLALHHDPDREEQYTAIHRMGDSIFGESFVSNLPTGHAHLSATASVLRDSKGNIVAAIECIRDNTERRQAEEALRSSEEQFKAIFETASIGVAQADPRSGQWLRVNQKMCEITGYSSAELLAMRIPEITHPEDRGRDWEAFQQVVRGGAPNYRIEKRYLRKDGAVVWVNVNMTVICDAAGLPLRTIATIEDITERRQAEIALRESEERFRKVVESAPDAIFVRSQSGHLVYLNHAAVNLFGAVSADPLIGRHIMERVHPDWHAVSAKRIKLLNEGQAVPVIEQTFLRMDGSPLSVEVSAVPLRYEGMNGALVFARDISERKRVEEDSRALQERLQRAEKMEALGMMAGGVAHDLNNVMGILVGYSELLLDDIDKSSPLRSHVEYIMQGGERASAIVQDLLSLARRGVQTREIVDLNSVIDEFQESPEYKKMCSFHPNVLIETVYAAGLLNIKGSSMHLRKTVMNLVSNATEAMPAGGKVTIATSNLYLDRPLPGYDDIQEGDYVVLSVTDTGEGISEKDLKKIFEPFYIKKVMGRSGTGLGLSVVWGTVKDHKGYISVQSEESKGTTFTLYFPVTREEISKEQTSVSISEYLGDGESILVVDDVQGQRELAARMLSKLNYRVAGADSGEEAVEYLKAHKVDLVVLDMIMDPGMDGLDTYRAIRKIHPGQKAIIVSGFSESDRVRKAQALGAGTYVRKPYVREILGIAVKKELGGLA